MVAARDVEFALIERLETIALQCIEKPRRYSDLLVVKDFTATNTTRCEALCAAHEIADDDFSPDVYKSFKALARDALSRHKSPREAVVASLMALSREAERHPRLNWLHEYAWLDIDKSQRARLASMSVSWIARLSSSLGYPDMSKWKGGQPAQWQFPDRGLRLDATIDAVTDKGNLVIVGPTTDAGDAKAAYAAVIFVADKKRVPEKALLVDLSRRMTRDFGMAELLDRGIQTAESAARAVFSASSGELSGLSRTPRYFNCRDCPGLGQCSEGQDLLHQPMTVSGGMRVL